MNGASTKHYVIATVSSLGGWVAGKNLVKDYRDADRYQSRRRALAEAFRLEAANGLEYCVDRVDCNIVHGGGL